jgi:hypothetical protein
LNYDEVVKAINKFDIAIENKFVYGNLNPLECKKINEFQMLQRMHD